MPTLLQHLRQPPTCNRRTARLRPSPSEQKLRLRREEWSLARVGESRQMPRRPSCRWILFQRSSFRLTTFRLTSPRLTSFRLTWARQSTRREVAAPLVASHSADQLPSSGFGAIGLQKTAEE